MSRNVRRMTPLLRALLATTATAVASPVAGGAVVATSAAVLAGCEDEQDPATHVERLEDPRRRQQAVQRLIQFFEDAMTKDNKNRDGEHVKPLLDQIVPPMAALAEKGELPQSTQGDLIKFLGDSRDERALPALIKALEDYRMDDGGAEKYDRQIASVIRNIGEMVRAGKIENNAKLNAALFDLFTRTHYSYPAAQANRFYQVLNRTLKAIADPSWEDRLIEMVEVPIKSTKKKFAKQVHDQAYWQLTAAEILGKLESAKAVVPLLKVTLSPFKAPVHNDAMIALIRIGKAAREKSLALLEGEATELVEYAKKEFLRNKEDQGAMPAKKKAKKKLEERAAKAYIDQAAKVVANVGTIGAIDPLLKTMEEGEDTTKQIIGSYLYLLPKEQKVIDRFREVYDETGVNDKLPGGSYAKEALLEAAGSFFDMGLLKHILETSHDMEGKKDDVRGVQVVILTLGAKGATPELWSHVEKLKEVFPDAKPKGDTWVYKGPKSNEEEKLTDEKIVEKLEALELSEKGMVKEDEENANFTPMREVPVFAPAVQKAQYARAVQQAKIVLDECEVDVDCYLKKLSAPEATKSETEMQALKAAYMVGLLGDESVKDKLLKELPKIENAGVRGVVGLIFLNKSPKGDPELADALLKMHKEALDSRSKKKIELMKPFKQIIYRLEARAGG